MVFPNNVAVHLEAAPSLVDHKCTYCPVQHSSRAWDCKKPGIFKKSVPVPGQTAYSPITGLPEAGYEIIDDKPRAKYRRLNYFTVRVNSVKKK